MSEKYIFASPLRSFSNSLFLHSNFCTFHQGFHFLGLRTSVCNTK